MPSVRIVISWSRGPPRNVPLAALVAAFAATRSAGKVTGCDALVAARVTGLASLGEVFTPSAPAPSLPSTPSPNACAEVRGVHRYHTSPARMSQLIAAARSRCGVIPR